MSIRKQLKTLFRLLVSRDYRLLRRARLFDHHYFCRLANLKGLDANDSLWHYLLVSRQQCRRFIESATEWEQLSDPHPLFDTAYYLMNYFPQGLGGNPLAHYLRSGWRSGYEPGPFFDTATYAGESGWDESYGPPLLHYQHIGAQHGLRPGLFFDVGWYIDKTPVLAQNLGNIVGHYKLFGAGEGKSPVPVFDPAYYLAQLDGAGPAGRDPLAHYLATGQGRDLNPCMWFDATYYKKHVMSGDEQGAPLGHYLAEGNRRQVYCDEVAAGLAAKPTFSLVVPVYASRLAYLGSCIRSVVYQRYPHWELCLADDCSPDAAVRQLLKEWQERDSRIKVHCSDANRGISATTNAAAAMATGDYIGFLDHDDELSPDCLYRLAETIQRTGADALYTDEDLVGSDSRRYAQFHKPDFNRHLLYSHNYITHFVAVSRALYLRLGGLNSRYDGAQDYDFVLRLAEEAATVEHVPGLLYHWRTAETSTSIDHGQKPYAHTAGRQALAEAMARLGYRGEVADGEVAFHYRLRYALEHQPAIAVLVVDRFGGWSAERLERLQSKTGYRNCRFVRVEQPRPQDLPGREPHEGSPGVAETVHRSLIDSTEEYCAILGEEVEDVEAGWLDELISALLQLSETALVCGRLRIGGEDGPSYTVPDLNDYSSRYLAAFLESASRHMNGLHNMQQVAFGHRQVCLMKRSSYVQAGGLDYRSFPCHLAMADLSARFHRQNMAVIYLPGSVAHAGNSGGAARKIGSASFDDRERLLFQQRWRDLDERLGRYYNTGILTEKNINPDRFVDWLCGRCAVNKDLT